MKENKYFSYNCGKLCKGCRQCIEGRKSVIFVTGLCPRNCYFCPISEEKKNNDVIFVNEKKIVDIKEIVDEIKLCSSKGASLTGGDPFCRLERSIEIIRMLKKEFGDDFHIHLYTSLDLVDENKLKRLYEAGLDEIRFHPDIDDDKLWNRIKLATGFSWDLGIEIPLIPGKVQEEKKLLSFVDGVVSFVNLNELEMADAKHNKLCEMGFRCKDQLSYAIKDSRQMGLELMKFVKENKIKVKVHLCTAKLKDAVQLANRLKHRAKNVQRNYEDVDEEGMLLRGIIFCKRKEYDNLRETFDLPEKYCEYDEKEEVLMIHPALLIEISPDIENKKEIRKIYPTADEMLIETYPI